MLLWPDAACFTCEVEGDHNQSRETAGARRLVSRWPLAFSTWLAWHPSVSVPTLVLIRQREPAFTHTFAPRRPHSSGAGHSEISAVACRRFLAHERLISDVAPAQNQQSSSRCIMTSCFVRVAISHSKLLLFITIRNDPPLLRIRFVHISALSTVIYSIRFIRPDFATVIDFVAIYIRAKSGRMKRIE